MARLLLLRHAQSTWNAAGRWQGQADPPLSADGEAQARRGALRLLAREEAPFSGVVASDLQRARRTAEILAEGLGMASPVLADPTLREFDVGEWSGLTREEITTRWPGRLEAWDDTGTAPPGGEDRWVFARRARAAVTRIGAGAPEGARVLVVAHGGLIRSLLATLGGEVWRVDHLSGIWLRVDAGDLSPEDRVDLDDGCHGRAVPSRL
ncbi:MAG: histidine phosphatase family protein [Acidimicrobiales bacterium]